MKKLSLSLMFFLTVQICLYITPLLAQENKEYFEIKNIVETFIKNIAIQDVNSAMQLVSVNYSSKKGDSIVDYAKFKSALEKGAASVSKKYMDISVADMKILKANIQNDKATLTIEYEWKGFNLDTLKDKNVKLTKIISLAKENGIWKIIKYGNLKKPKQQSPK